MLLLLLALFLPDLACVHVSATWMPDIVRNTAVYRVVLFAARKIPMLFFSGDVDGTLTKWERSQSNYFVYRYLIVKSLHFQVKCI